MFITSSCCWVGSLGARRFCQAEDWQKGFYWWFVSPFKGVLLWSSNSKNSVPVFRNQEPRGTSGSTGGQDKIPHAVLHLMLIERIVNILNGWMDSPAQSCSTICRATKRTTGFLWLWPSHRGDCWSEEGCENIAFGTSPWCLEDMS